jgi:phosphoenolpyruvate synthase/pyruvate phosphate dikinase
MCNIGIPVPPGFTITTKACQKTIENGMHWPDSLYEQVIKGVNHIEKDMNLGFGDPNKPLLLSVRSGAAVSMPGMMDTILNLGMNDLVAKALIDQFGNERFVYDSYRRFIDMFGDVVMGVEHSLFEETMEKLKAEVGASSDLELNAETPEDAKVALDLGAQGIGLARTEHMFFGADRIRSIRKMIMSENEEERAIFLKELLPYQKEDFKDIFRVMAGYPVTIRLLDPPLHEFLPHDENELEAMAIDLQMPIEQLKRKVVALEEHNPMLGHRGCRLGITHPEITKMQTRAILESALELLAEGMEIKPEIMVPLVGNVREFKHQKRLILEEAEKVFEQYNARINVQIGTMIEVPRAALTANEIAEEADFFSFGTNDLTQMTLGYSRDDAATFIPSYLDAGILTDDPFQTIDREGVGQLIHMAKELGSITNPNLKMGICGEHGGDPRSIELCHELGLNYVSCSPFRVPVAHLSVAQSAIKQAIEDSALYAC